MYSKSSVQLLLDKAPKELLTAEQEWALGRTIQTALNSQDPQLLEAGEKARVELFEHNLRLVASEAYKYSGYKLPLEDLVQEGALGLLTAINKFDPERKFRFSTAAVPWIKQAITRYIAEYRKTIRFPVHISEMLSKINKASIELFQTLEREPTEEEISELLEGKITADKIRYLRQVTQPISSTNAIVGDEEDSELGDFIEDNEDQSPQEYAIQSETEDKVQVLLNCLNEQERKIMEWRWGLNGGTEYTLEEVGAFLNLTRERVRQLEKEALNKMRIFAQNNRISR